VGFSQIQSGSEQVAGYLRGRLAAEIWSGLMPDWDKLAAKDHRSQRPSAVDLGPADRLPTRQKKTGMGLGPFRFCFERFKR